MMNPPKFTAPARQGSTFRHALGGVAYVRNDRRLSVIFALFTVVGIFGWSYGVLMPAYARDILKVQETGYGMLMSAAGFGALIGALLTAALGGSIPRRPAVLGGVWVFSVTLFLFAVVHVYTIALLCLMIGSFGMMLFMSTANTLIQTSVPDDMRGRVMGVWALIFGAVIPIGSLEAGALARWIGVSATIAFGAVVCAGAALVTWLSIRRKPPAPAT